MDKANRLKNNYLGIILFLRTNFDNVPPVSFGEEWIYVKRIKSFCPSEKIVLINFYKIIWNNLTKQFVTTETSKGQQIPQEVTYGENLVKDNSIAPSAKR